MDKNVIVLLSTYNGEKFLREQLDSILSQSYPPSQIIIRDDGSTDSTISILDEYTKRHKTISYYVGANIKPAFSFLDLLKKSPNADFYAFSDQDDVWLSNKLEVAINSLLYNDGDLYHSAFQMVDSELNYIETPPKPNVNTLGEALVLIPATGCTMMISKKMRDYANLYNPQYIIMHDYWLLKLAYALECKVIYDECPHILYRQHGNNVLGGVHKSDFELWKGRFFGFFHPERERWNELYELYNGYHKLFSTQSKATICPIVGYLNESIYGRIKIAFNRSYRSISSEKNLLFKIAIVTKRY